MQTKSRHNWGKHRAMRDALRARESDTMARESRTLAIDWQPEAQAEQAQATPIIYATAPAINSLALVML